MRTLLGVLLLFVFVPFFTVSAPSIEAGYTSVNDCFIQSRKIPEIPETRTYGTLIECLEWHESRDNPKAVGKAGEIGCMQFLPSTFSQYCEGNIWSCEDQKNCAESMLNNNWNNINHWTTKGYCISN